MYADSLQHILAELERLDLLLRVQVGRARAGRGEAGDVAAFCISDAEADEFLDRMTGMPVWAGVPLPPELRAATQERLDRLGRDIVKHTGQSLDKGVPLRLDELRRVFGLSQFDADVILLCLAPELDQGYERLYAYLHDDLTRRQPTAGLALNLFCADLASKVAARGRLTQAGPLLRFQLVELPGESGSLLNSGLRLAARVTRFLLCDDAVDDRLRPYVSVVRSPGGRNEDAVPAAFADQLSRLAEHARTSGSLLYLEGDDGDGNQAAAAACARAVERPLLVVAGKRLAAVAGQADEFAALARLAVREARLQGALMYWAGFDALLADADDARLADLFSLMETLTGGVLLSGAASWEPTGAWREREFLRIAVPPPGFDERLRTWRAALAGGGTACEAGLADLADLAGKFRLNGGQIRDAAATGRNLALVRAPDAPAVSPADLHAACRLHSNRKLAELAVSVAPNQGWDDIVLPDDEMAQLREIHDQVRQRNRVYQEWGFDDKLAAGKGVDVLFAGPPGTGKTMAAGILAAALGLSLYKIDLSAVVSKYIGETEKNLARIFAEAATSNAVLFFDEADALFGKRTAVRDAHDRYANVEVSYLLQKMEEFDGIVVLATNLRKNMDEAFVRRLHATVEFPVPGAADRRRIWERIWPAAMPRDPGLDLDFLAERVEVTGGSIRNIALASAFLAAADDGPVTMAHVLHSIRREYQKMGKLLVTADLGYPPG